MPKFKHKDRFRNESGMEYSLVKVDLASEGNQIIEFWKKHFPGWPEGKFNWLYKNNIYGSATCWAIKTATDNRIVGSLAVFPKHICINGKIFRAGIAGDLGIAREHRRQGLALWLRQELILSLHNGQFDILYGTPNDTSVNIIIKSGYKRIGYPERMVKILNSYYFFKRRVKLSQLARMFSIPVDKVMNMIAAEKKRKLMADYDYEVLSSFDHRFDEFWSRNEKNQFIMGERSSHFLNWRFRDCSYEKFQAFALVNRKDKSIAAYLVYRLLERDAQIVDLLYSGNDDMLHELLCRFIGHVRSQNYERITIYYFGNERIREILRLYGFHPLSEPRSFVVYVTPDFEFYNLIHQSSDWLFLEADSDV